MPESVSGRQPVGIVHHQAEIALANALHIHMGHELFGIVLDGIAGVVDRADLIEVGTSEIFAEEDALDCPFGCAALVHALGIHEADIDDPLIEWADAYMDAG